MSKITPRILHEDPPRSGHWLVHQPSDNTYSLWESGPRTDTQRINWHGDPVDIDNDSEWGETLGVKLTADEAAALYMLVMYRSPDKAAWRQIAADWWAKALERANA